MNFRNITLLLLSFCVSSAVAMMRPAAYEEMRPAAYEERRNVMSNRLHWLTNLGYDKDEIMQSLPDEERFMLQAHFDRIALTQEDPATAKGAFIIEKILFDAKYNHLIGQNIPNAQKIIKLNNFKDKIKAHKKAYTQMDRKQARRLRIMMGKIQRKINQLQPAAPVRPSKQLFLP